MDQLKLRPYGSYAVLKAPDMFERYNLLSEALELVSKDDIIDFVTARHENVKHFNAYVKTYSERTSKRGSSLQKLEMLQAIMQKTKPEDKKSPGNI